MKLTDTQLMELRSRCIRAAARSYWIAQVDQYLNLLAEETGMIDVPQGVRKGSAEHLKLLVQEALDQRSGKKPKVVKAEKVKSLPVAPKAELVTPKAELVTPKAELVTPKAEKKKSKKSN